MGNVAYWARALPGTEKFRDSMCLLLNAAPARAPQPPATPPRGSLPQMCAAIRPRCAFGARSGPRGRRLVGAVVVTFVQREASRGRQRRALR